MKLFCCQNCGHIVYFENSSCGFCGYRLGYTPERADLIAVVQQDEGWSPVGAPERQYRFCTNAQWDACNWLIDAASPAMTCAACRYNRTIPDLAIDENVVRWRKIEQAKHHLFYTLQRFGLKAQTRTENPDTGLAFDFLTDAALPPGQHVMTGHDDALITLNLAEADDGIREKLREELGENYRTLLGHFRHEIGHFYWDRLVRDGGQLDSFRACFGDERQDYDTALQTYYAQGPAPDWQNRFVTAYASAHPWEDFAETWAHYLHMVDTLEMVRAYGINVHPVIVEDRMSLEEIQFDPHDAENVEQLVTSWLPVTLAVNSINRCMGQPDLYPFVIPQAAVEKFGYIHALIHGHLPLAVCEDANVDAAA